MSASTVVVVAAKQLSFIWKDYGLKLHVPTKCLPVGLSQCNITVMVSIAGQYDFPENRHPVSAIFWLRCEPPCNFVKPVTLEMDHCAKQENVSKLRFVKATCSQKNISYTFRKSKKEGHGIFNEHTSYGVLELHNSSGIGVVQKDSMEIGREYCAMLFYVRKPILGHEFQIHFVVTWNTIAHLSVRSSNLAQIVWLLLLFSDFRL